MGSIDLARIDFLWWFSIFNFEVYMEKKQHQPPDDSMKSEHQFFALLLNFIGNKEIFFLNNLWLLLLLRGFKKLFRCSIGVFFSTFV